LRVLIKGAIQFYQTFKLAHLGFSFVGKAYDNPNRHPE
jgi:hypothetical protein